MDLKAGGPQTPAFDLPVERLGLPPGDPLDDSTKG